MVNLQILNFCLSLAEQDVLTLPWLDPILSCSSSALPAAIGPTPTPASVPAPEPVPAHENSKRKQKVAKKTYTTEDLRKQFYLRKIKIAKF